MSLLIYCICCTVSFQVFSQRVAINGFTVWQTGHDAQTLQVVPEAGGSALTQLEGAAIAHAKFIVHEYGELWFPLANTPPDMESARRRSFDQRIRNHYVPGQP